MTLLHCPECGKEISIEAQSCPHCGISDPFDVEGDKDPGSKSGCSKPGCLAAGVAFCIGAILAVSQDASRTPSVSELESEIEAQADANVQSQSMLLEDRQEIFRALAIEQDESYCWAKEAYPYDMEARATAADSAARADIREVAERFDVRVGRVEQIMEEGATEGWSYPPSNCPP